MGLLEVFKNFASGGYVIAKRIIIVALMAFIV
jgi:hypothetical protein